MSSMKSLQNQTVDHSRRALFRGRPGYPGRAPVRPPWAVTAFEQACTRCDKCVDDCPQGILVRGDGGYPEVDFNRGRGECTFCGACADACPEPAFDRSQAAPWSVVADIGRACLNHRGVHCQSCAEVCEWDAIRFTLVVGGPPRPELDADACSGCGACVSVCPADAITTQQREAADER